MKNLNGYELSRDYWSFAFENPEKVKPLHAAIYFFAVEQCNAFGWKEKFGFPSSMAMEATGVKSYRTYISALEDLVEWGFIDMVEKSRNQYTANIIALVKNTKAHDKALDKAHTKAIPKHVTKQGQSTGKSKASIDKLVNNETSKLIKEREGEQVATPPQSQIDLDLKQPDEAKEKKAAPKKRKVFQPPTEAEVEAYCKENGYRVSAVRFVSFYQSKNWHVGKNKMTDWKSACRNWDQRDRQEAKSKDVAPIGHHIEGRRNYSLEDFYGTPNKK